MSGTASRRSILTGYLCALGAGVLWGTTGPLSTALYGEGTELTDVGFWRVLVAGGGLLAWGLARPALFRIDRRGLVLIAGIGGALVALFEVAYQYAIAGVGVAGAATLLYTAPVLVAFLAHGLLGERLTPARVGLALVVAVGVALTVAGGGEGTGPAGGGRVAGIAGGLLAAGSFAGTTILARWAVPRHGAVRVLFYELAGGTLLLGLLLPLGGRVPAAPGSAAGWIFVGALGLGSVLAANFLFFGGVRRIEAAPAAVAASIEPVVGALLALSLFGQELAPTGWLGLAMVVGGVGAGYLREADPRGGPAPAAVASRGTGT